MESKQWKPSSWTEGAIQLRVRRVYRHALRSLEDIIGPHKARIVYAEFKAQQDSEQSRIALQGLGVLTIGEKEAMCHSTLAV